MKRDPSRPSHVAECQRLDRYYYRVARDGYDATTGERGPLLQTYAARRAKGTRELLTTLIDRMARAAA